jgi:serine/threonine protein phosphatase PrpC
VLTISAAAVTNVGLLREFNEDYVLTTPELYAVADGMGGHAAGDVASAMAVEVLRRLAKSEQLTSDDIINGLAAANDAILTSAIMHPERSGMGTTAAGLAVVQLSGGPHWIVFNVGDSRVYRYAHGALQQLTVDHSEVEEMIAAGELDPAEARMHPRRNVVTRCLGSDPFPDPDVWVFPPEAGERFVICSDGLTIELPDAVIEDVLSTEAGAAAAAETLVQLALTAGGRDNISVIVVNHESTQDASPIDDTTTPRARPLGSG